MSDKPNKFVKHMIWHQALTTPQSMRIHAIHAAIGSEILGLFEHFEMRFLEELNIDETITHYEKIVDEFTNWRKGHLKTNISLQKETFEQMFQKIFRQGKD
jgi:hypothetical protein